MTDLMNTVSYMRISLVLAILLSVVSCEPDPEPGPNLYERIVALPNTTTFIQAVDRAEFDDDFQSGQFLTLFVPSDDAFEDFLNENNFASIDDVPLEDLRDLLRYHLLGYGTPLADLGNNYYLTASGAGFDNNFLAILILNPGGNATLNNEVEVVSQDNEANGSYYNTIDKVLSLPTNLSVIRQNDVFTQFADGINRIGSLVDSLGGAEPYSLFVATDAKVEATLEARYDIDDMADLPLTTVDSLMRFHVIRGQHKAQELQNAFQSDYPTLLPDQVLEISSSGSGNIFVNSRVPIIFPDIQTTNGVVHILDDLLDLDN